MIASITSTRRRASLLAALAVATTVAATAACGGSGTGPELRASGGPAGDAYRVEIVNTGTVTLQDLSIVTGEDQPPIQVASLGAGQRTAPHAIGVLHENPIVSATVAGERRISHPVEGFTGFNPPVEPGRYVISLKWNAEHEMIEPLVTRAP
jgi:hypothetical protein